MKFENIVLILILILGLHIVHAMDIGITPGSMVIHARQGKASCANFTLAEDGNSTFLGEMRWSNVASRNIKDYALNSSPKGINVSFDKTARPGKHEICITGTPGRHHGVLLYKLRGSHYGVGAWIEISSQEEQKTGAIYLTGKTIKGDIARTRALPALAALLLLALIAVTILIGSRNKKK